MDDLKTMLDEFKAILTQELGSEIIVNIDDEKMNEFKKIINEFCLIADRYGSSISELTKFAESNTRKTEFCIQSKYLHRGFYCPSPVLELLIENCKRGKLTAKPYKTTRDYYKYNFDNNNSMVSAEHYITGLSCTPLEIEFIIRDGDVEYGITFSNHKEAADYIEITYISMAKYENSAIKSYSADLFSKYIPKENMSLHHEEYFYSGKLLTEAHIYFNILPLMNIYDKNECFFRYDGDKKIYEYDVIREHQGKPIKSTYTVPKSKYIHL